MTIVDKPLEEMLTEIGNPSKIKSDRVVPWEYYPEGKFENSEVKDFQWSFDYQAQLVDFLEENGVCLNLHSDPRQNPVIKALENAYNHTLNDEGNSDLKLPIDVEIYKGEEGVIFTITDSGKGFDFAEVAEKMKKQEKYFQNAGHGFLVYDFCKGIYTDGLHYEVSGKGNRINIMYKFEK